MTHLLTEHYQDLLLAGELEPDLAQAQAVRHLDALALALGKWRPRRSWLATLLDGGTTPPPRGLFIYGSVGRGKTMLMDLFFDVAPVAPKRRVHFHQFMAQVHDLIFAARKTTKGDPIGHVAQLLAERSSLLCFDELHVTDITDAMILGRLFKALFENGVVIVATSNAPASQLYKDGLNRALFEPFIDLIDENMTVFELAAAKDFRLDKLNGRKLYFTPDDDEAHGQMDDLWHSLTGGAAGFPTRIELKGRMLHVPLAAHGVAWFNFVELCDRPLGSLDYLTIAQNFHTVLIDGIPVLTKDKRNQARRFINLIDTLYDHGITLAASAGAEPHELYIAGEGADHFARTASRLIEMRSEDYLQAREKARLER